MASCWRFLQVRGHSGPGRSHSFSTMSPCLSCTLPLLWSAVVNGGGGLPWVMALLFFCRSQADARGSRYIFFDVFPFAGISYWYRQVGGEQRLLIPSRHRRAGAPASWEYDNVGVIASRELCMLRDPGQHQVGLVFCHVGAPRQKGDGGALGSHPQPGLRPWLLSGVPTQPSPSKVACPVL